MRTVVLAAVIVMSGCADMRPPPLPDEGLRRGSIGPWERTPEEGALAVDGNVVTVNGSLRGELGELVPADVLVPAGAAVKPALAELRLTEWRAVDEALVSLEDAHHVQVGLQRILQALGPHQLQIVGRRVVFGVFTVRCTHHATDREIKSRRAVLPLVVSER